MSRALSIMCLCVSSVIAQLVVSEPALPCLVHPAIQVAAGTNLTYQIISNVACDATISFGNPDFLPLTSTVLAMKCDGERVAAINIPMHAPDGSATLQWRCAGSAIASCNILNVTGGLGEVNRYLHERRLAASNARCMGGDPSNPIDLDAAASAFATSRRSHAPSTAGTHANGTGMVRPTGAFTGASTSHPQESCH